MATGAKITESAAHVAFARHADRASRGHAARPWLASLVLALTVAIGPSAVRADGPIPVGVVDFTSSVGTNWTRRLPELIVDELVNSGLFDVLEREKLGSLASEIDFQAGALVDPSKAVRFGGMSGARLLVTGNIIESGGSSQTSTAYNIRSTVRRHHLKARAEVIDLESGSKIFSRIADSTAVLKQVGLNSTGRGEDSLGPDVAGQLVAAIVENPRIRAMAGDAAPDEPVSVTIESEPEGADVEIDGVYYGNAGGTFEVTPGVHEIVVSRPGFNAWRKKVKVDDGLTFKATLAETVDARVEVKVESNRETSE